MQQPKTLPNHLTKKLLPIILKFDDEALQSLKLTKDVLKPAMEQIFLIKTKKADDFDSVSVCLRLNFQIKSQQQFELRPLLLQFFYKISKTQGFHQLEYITASFKSFFLNSLRQFKNQQALSLIMINVLDLLGQLIENSCLADKLDVSKAIQLFKLEFLRLFLALTGKIVTIQDIQQEKPYTMYQADYKLINQIATKIVKKDRILTMFKMLHYCSLQLYLLIFPDKFPEENYQAKYLVTEAKRITKIWTLSYKFHFLENYINVLIQLLYSNQKELGFWFMTIENLVSFVSQKLYQAYLKPEVFLRQESFIKLLCQTQFHQKLFNFLDLIEQKIPATDMQKFRWHQNHCIQQTGKIYQRQATNSQLKIDKLKILIKILKIKIKDQTQNRRKENRQSPKVLFIPGQTLDEFSSIKECDHFYQERKKQKRQQYQQAMDQIAAPSHSRQKERQTQFQKSIQKQLLDQLCLKINSPSIVQRDDQYCFLQTNILFLNLIKTYNSTKSQKPIQNERVIKLTSKEIYESIPLSVLDKFLKSLIFDFKFHQINQHFLQKLHTFLIDYFTHFAKHLQIRLLSDQKARLIKIKQNQLYRDPSNLQLPLSQQEIIGLQKLCFWISLARLSVTSNRQKAEIKYCESCLRIFIQQKFCFTCSTASTLMKYKSPSIFQSSIENFIIFQEQCRSFETALIVIKKILTKNKEMECFGTKFILSMMKLYFSLGKQSLQKQFMCYDCQK